MEPRSYCLQMSACRLVGILFFGILFWGGLSCRSEEGVNFDFDFEEAKWHPTLNTDFETGSRHLAQLGFSLPLKQGDDSLFFFDFRGWIDDDHNDEYNVGFAYRKLLDDRIVGFYGYFDRHFTQYSGNRFDQITLGTEILGECWDHRFNAYIPTDFGGRGRRRETSQLSQTASTSAGWRRGPTGDLTTKLAS